MPNRLMTFWIVALLLSGSIATAQAACPRAAAPKKSRCSSCAKKRALNQVVKKPEGIRQRDLLVVGCPRSGTTFMNKVLNTYNVQVGHETDGKRGIVSWLFTANSKNPAWGPRPADYKFKHIFHQVRHPLKCIATMHLVVSKAWEYIAREVPEINLEESRLVCCAKMWVYWNLKAEKRAEMTYRVENIREALPDISQRIGTPLDPQILETISTKTHASKHNYVVTWEDLHNVLEPAFYKKLVLLAKRYGYQVEEGLALIRESSAHD